eukprot:14787-Heterococcus_DN1.PRE.3
MSSMMECLYIYAFSQSCKVLLPSIESAQQLAQADRHCHAVTGEIRSTYNLCPHLLLTSNLSCVSLSSLRQMAQTVSSYKNDMGAVSGFKYTSAGDSPTIFGGALLCINTSYTVYLEPS